MATLLASSRGKHGSSLDLGCGFEWWIVGAASDVLVTQVMSHHPDTAHALQHYRVDIQVWPLVSSLPVVPVILILAHLSMQDIGSYACNADIITCHWTSLASASRHSRNHSERHSG